MRDNSDNLTDQLGCRSYGPIREAVAVAEAQALRIGLQEHAPGSKVAADYMEFVDQFLAEDREAQEG